MNCELITNASCANIGSKSIALFFAGWGMDATPFRNMAIDCDMAVVWDYSNLEIDLSILREYQSIYLFAWSFGIFAATAFMHRNPQLPIVFKMAINGTQFPIDDSRGIPHNLFCATRDNLSERSLAKFHRRICGSQSKYAQWITMLPSRSLQSLHDELVAIDTAASSGNYPPVHWDKAIASKCDLIFPFENQMTGWEGLCDTIEIDETSAHFPDDLETLINGNIINKKLIKQRFANSLNGGTYDNNASIQQKIATTLHDLWKSTIGIKNDAEITPLCHQRISGETCSQRPVPCAHSHTQPQCHRLHVYRKRCRTTHISGTFIRLHSFFVGNTMAGEPALVLQPHSSMAQAWWCHCHIDIWQQQYERNQGEYQNIS